LRTVFIVLLAGYDISVCTMPGPRTSE